MPSVVIFSFCIFLQSLLHVQWLAYSHPARRAPSFTVSFLSIVVHIDIYFVCYCTKEPKIWTNVFVLLSFELVRYRTVCLYDFPPATSSSFVSLCFKSDVMFVATFQVLTAVWLKMPVFWHMASCVYQSIRRNIFRFTPRTCSCWNKF